MTTQKNLTQKGILGIAIAIFMTGAVTTGTYYWATKESFIAKVNNQPIAIRDFSRWYDLIKKQDQGAIGMDYENPQGQAKLAALKQKVLQQLIDAELLKQKSSEMGISVTPTEIDDELDKFIKESDFRGDKNAFNDWLLKERIDISFVKEDFFTKILRDKIKDQIVKNVQMKEDEVKKHYEQNKTTYYTNPESVEAKHILIKIDASRKEAEAKKIAEGLIKQLKEGAKFEDLAKKHSEDVTNKERGGELGAVKRGDMVPEFEMATWKHQDKYDHCGVTDFTAMNLVPFLVTAHYASEYAELLKEKIRQSQYPVRILTDDQAILVQNGSTKLVGKGDEIKL